MHGCIIWRWSYKPSINTYQPWKLRKTTSMRSFLKDNWGIWGIWWRNVDCIYRQFSELDSTPLHETNRMTLNTWAVADVVVTNMLFPSSQRLERLGIFSSCFRRAWGIGTHDLWKRPEVVFILKRQESLIHLQQCQTNSRISNSTTLWCQTLVLVEKSFWRTEIVHMYEITTSS